MADGGQGAGLDDGGQRRAPSGRWGSWRGRSGRAAAALLATLAAVQGGLPLINRVLPGAALAQAATASTIECNGQPFISRDAWRLSNADTASATFAEGPAVATATSPRRYNGLGFNVLDGNVYAIYGGTAVNGVSNALTRISPTGTVQNLGAVTGLPSTLSYQAGDVDENGIMWVKPVNVTAVMYRIDLNVQPYTATTRSLLAAVGIEDLAYNPVDGMLYGWTFNPVGRIAQINPNTGAVVLKDPAGLDAQANGESVWFDGMGNMHVAFRDIGDVYRFSNLSAAAPTATKISDRNAVLAATDNSMDAAGCPYAPTIDKTFTPSTLSSAVGSTTVLTLVLRNVLDTALNIDLSDTLPTGLMYDAGSLAVSNGTGTPNAYGGTGALTVTSVSVPANGSVSVTVVVRTIGTNIGGTLNNQARLTVPAIQAVGVPAGVIGATIFSNNPAATLINEPTPINVYDSLECSTRWMWWNGTGTANTGDLGWWNTAPTPWVGGGTQLLDLAGGPYEIMEYSVEDGFFYTLPATGNTLTLVDSAERRQTLGAVTNLPAAFAVAAAGADEAGNLYVKAGGAGTALYRIDISTRTATLITLSTSINIQDIAVNPFGSNQAFAVTTAGQLATINLTTGAVTLKAITGGAGVTDSEGLWFDDSGTLYALNQASNDVYAITNLTAATATATRVSGDRAGVFGTDGTVDSTSCPYSPLARKSWSPSSITSPASTTLTINVVNPLDVPVSVDVTDVLPTTLVQYVDGSLAVSNGSGVANAYGDTQTLTVTGVAVPANGTTVITVTVNNPLALGGVVDNQARVTVPAGQPGVPAPLANTTTVSDNQATSTVFQDKTRLVMAGPLECGNTAYIMQQRATDTWGSLYGLDQTVADPTLELLYPTSPATTSNVNPPSEFNGIGYNVVDGYIYGSVGTVAAGQPASIGLYDIVRIDGAGNAVYINVTRPAGAPAPSLAVGEVDANGFLYRPVFYSTGGDGVEIINLNNVNSGTTPPSVSSTIVRLANQFPAGFADWAFNPTDGLLYTTATDTTTDPNTIRLYRINPVTGGTVTAVGAALRNATTNVSGAGAIWFDAFGSLYSYHNFLEANTALGAIWRWENPDTAAPRPVLIDDDFPGTAGNDGTRCAYYPGFTKDVTPRIAPAGAVVTYTYTIRNGFPEGGNSFTVDFSDLMDAGRTYVPGTVTIAGQVSAGTPALAALDTQLDIPDIEVAAQGTVTITVEVQTDPSTPELDTTVYNQAVITGAVAQPVYSDYPGTEDVLDDPTPLVLVRSLECTDEAFLSHNVSPFAVTSFDRLTGEEAAIGEPEILLNSLGFNPLDGLLYSLNSSGVAGTSNDLQVIDADGNIFDLGDVANLPDTLAYNGGTFDAQGRLWVKSNAANVTTLYAIDVATRTAIAVPISSGIPNFGDFAYNPLDGRIYAFNWVSAGADQIYAIDISSATGTKPVTITTFTAPAAVGSVAQAQWIDGAGNLFIREATDGQVWLIENATTATPAMILIGTAPSGAVDGASCARPELLKDVNPGEISAGETVTYTFRLTNPTPGLLSMGLLDVQDAGRTFLASTLTVTNEAGANVPAGDYTVNTYGGANTLDIDGLDVPSGEVWTVTVQVQTLVSTPSGTLLNQAELTDLPARYGTVVSDFPDTTDSFDDPTPVEVLGAGVDVEKSHAFTADAGQPGAGDVGDQITYTYAVTNTGAVPITIAVTDLVEGTTPLTASCVATTLQPAPDTPSSTTCTATYTVTQADLDAQGGGDGDLDNVVTATGTTVAGFPVVDTDPDVTPLAQLANGLVVDKTYAITTDAGTPGIADAGDVVSYSYRITNTGSTTLTNLTAVDEHEGTGAPVPGALTCSNTSLLPNQSATCTATYTVVQSDVNTIADGFLDDVVLVTATDPLGNTLTGNDAESVPLPAQQASITVDKTYAITTDAGVTGSVDPNDVVTYSFRVINNGNTTLDNATLDDVREYAPDLAITCPEAPQSLDPGEAVTCIAASVTVSEADVLAEQTDTDSQRSINDTVTARATESGTSNMVSDTDEEAVPVVALTPVYDPIKTSSIDPPTGDGFVDPGEAITYTITVTNIGLVDGVNVPVTDPIPENTTFVTAGQGGVHNVTLDRVEWTVPSIAAEGGTATLTFTVQADDPIPPGTIYIGNQATIDGSTPSCADPDEDGDPATCDPTLDPINWPSIDVEKSHVLDTDAGQTGVADVDDVIEYTYRVRNSGNSALTAVAVSDLLEGVGVTVVCGGVTTLAIGEVINCTSTHTVTQAEFDAAGGGDGDLDNVVTATGTSGAQNVSDSDDDVVQLAQPAPGLTVDKRYALADTDANGVADVGEVVTYTYVISNTGTVTLTGVGASDDHEGAGVPAPGSLTCAPTTLAPNQQATCTATYTLVQNDIDASADDSLDNTVTATGTTPGGATLTATDSESVPLPQDAPAITVDKTWTISPDGGTPGFVDAGDTVHYSYVLTNNGNVTLNVVGGDDVHELLGSTAITCPGVSLAPNQAMTCTSQWTATQTQVLAEQGDGTKNSVTDAVMARGTAPDGNIVSDTDDEAVPVVVLYPQIDVEKSHELSTDVDGDGFADAGDEVTYTFVVTNTGSIALSNVAVSDVFEGGTPTPATCPGTTLAIGESMNCTLTYTVTQVDIDGAGGGDGDLDNVVTASATSVNGSVTDSDVDVVALAQPAPGLSVEKTAVISTDVNANGIADEGDIVTYTYTVTNTGDEVLIDVAATDDHESIGLFSLNCPTPTLAPNQSMTCDPTTYTVSQSDIDNADDPTLDDVVMATAETPAGATLLGWDAESVPLAVAAPAISVDKQFVIDPDGGTPGVVDAGDVVTYTYIVTNNGNATLTNVGVTDVHELAGAMPAPCLATTLDPGDSTACSNVYTATAPHMLGEQDDQDTSNSITDIATAAGTAPDGNVVSDTDDEAAPVVALLPAIDVEKAHTLADGDLDGFADVGDQVTYTYTVRNTGAVELTNVIVSDVLEGAPLAVTCPGTTLAVGATMTCDSTHIVTQTDVDEAGGGDGDLDNTVTATGDSVNGQVSDSDTDVAPLGADTALGDAGIAVQKTWAMTSDPNLNGLGDVGDVATYAYTVTNTGDEQLTNLVVEDTHEGAGAAPGLISCPDTTLDPGESVTCTGTAYTLVAGDFPGDDFSLDDTVTATAERPDSSTLFGQDSESVPLVVTTPNTPAIALDKEWALTPDSDLDGIADIGETVTNTFTVINNGTVVLNDVGVSDVQEYAGARSATCDATTLAPGESTTCELTYTLTEENAADEQDDADSPLVLADVATAAGTAPDGNIVRDTDEEGVPVTFLVQAIDVEKTHAITDDDDGDGFADAGDEITYTYLVANTGGVALTDVTVSDLLEGAAVTVDCGGVTALAVGASMTCTSTYVVTQADIDAAGGGDSDLDNTVTASGTSVLGPLSDADTDIVPLGAGTTVDDAGIAVQKAWDLATDTNSNGLADGNDVVIYTYTVTNTGAVQLTGLVVDDAHEGVGSPVPDVIACPDTTLDPNESVTCTATYTVVAGDFPGDDFTLDDTVTATATRPDNSTLHGTDSESVPLVVTTPNTPAITLDKEWTLSPDGDGDGVGDAGDVIEYEFRVINNGSVTLTGVGVTDVHEGSPQLQIACPDTTLDPGEAMTCTASYTLQSADVLAEQTDADSPLVLADVATASGTAPNGNVVRDTDEEGVPVTVLVIDVSSVKTVTDASGDGLASPGEVLTYAIVITNDGNGDAVDAPFVDNLNPNTTFVGGSVTIAGVAQAALDPRTPGFPVTIPADSAVAVTFQVTVASPLDEAVTVIANQSTIGGEVSCPDDQAAQPCEPTVIPVGRASLTLDKTHVWVVDRGAAGLGDANDLVRYEYLVSNSGDVALTGVTVTDDHGGTGTLSTVICPDTTTTPLAAGASITCAALYTVTQEDVDGNGGGDGVIPNTATAHGTPPVANDIASAPDTDEILLSPAMPLLSIDKQYDIGTDGGVAGQAEASDIVTYTYVVSNTGNVTLDDVDVVDDHEGSISVVDPDCGAGPITLAPGEQMTCTATYTVTAADQTLTDGHIDDVATASGTAPNSDPVTSSDEESVPVVIAAPAITLDKLWELTTDNGAIGFADADDVVTYTYVISNNGNVGLDPVVLADVHDGSGSFTQPACPVTTLAPGTNTTCSAIYVVTQDDLNAGGSITDTATATGTPPVGPDVADIDGEAVPLAPAIPAIAVEKEPAITTDGGTPGEADPGDVITYTYIVTNTGNVTLTGVAVTDDHSGTGTLSAITCDVTVLAPQEVATCTAIYTVTAEDVAAGGFITNVATATGTPPTGGPVGDDDPAQVKVIDVAGLTIDKAGSFADTASKGTPAALDAGEVITYGYTVRNTGNIPVDGIVVTDVHEGDSAIVVPQCSATSLQPGQQMVCTAAYTVTEADVVSRGGGDARIDNTASASGTTQIGPVTTGPDSESLALTEPRAEVTLDKRAVGSATTYTVGQTVAYEIEAINTGNITLTNVSIVDARIPDLDCGGFDGVLSPGEHVICTGTLVVTQADADAGRVINTATVTADQALSGTVSATDTTEVLAVPLQVPPTTVPPPPTTVPPSPPSTGDLPGTGGNSAPIAQLALLVLALGAVVLLTARGRFRRRGGAVRVEATGRDQRRVPQASQQASPR